MREQQIITRLQTILYEGDVIRAESEITNLQSDYEQLKQSNKSSDVSVAIEASETEAVINDLLNKIRIKRENLLLKNKNQRELYISEKKEVIRDLRKMLENQDNISKSYEQINEIQQRWRATGRMSEQLGIDLENEYNVHLDAFYVNISINKDLRDLDYQKNLEAKRQIITKLAEVPKIDDIRRMDSAWKRVQSDWRSVGPVHWDHKDEINTEYHNINGQIVAKLDAYYNERREEMDGRLNKKIALCEKMYEVNKKDMINTRTWKTNTEAVLQIQSEWREIGFSTENEKIWGVFRNACDAFFEKKRQFFDGLDQKRQENTIVKQKLIGEADALQNQDNNNWKVNTERFLALQRRWKEAGPAISKEEPILWNKFRTICDKFFKKKRDFYTSLDDAQVVNLEKKLKLIEKIEGLALENPEEDYRVLKEISAEWNEIGYVPFKKKDEVIQKYRSAMEARYKDLKLNQEQLKGLEFETRMNRLMKGEKDQESVKQNERRRLTDKMERLSADISRYENNLGFFGAHADDSNPLVKEVMSKIDRLRGQLESMKMQVKAIDTIGSKAAEEEATENAESKSAEGVAAENAATETVEATVTETATETTETVEAVKETVVTETTTETAVETEMVDGAVKETVTETTETVVSETVDAAVDGDKTA